jgi:hypothetical protein
VFSISTTEKESGKKTDKIITMALDDSVENQVFRAITGENRSEIDSDTKKLSLISNVNKPKSYEFIPNSDVKLLKENESVFYSFSIFANISKMLNKNISEIRVIVSNDKIKNINSIEPDKVIDFKFNINDYFDISKKQSIKDTGVVKTIQVSKRNNNLIELTKDNNEIFKSVVTYKKSLGELLKSKKININEILSSDSLNEEDISFTENSVILQKKFPLHNLKESRKMFFKILEIAKNPITGSDVYISVNDFFVYTRDIRKAFKKTNSEFENKLSSFGFNDSSKAIHSLTVENEIKTPFFVFKKNDVNEKFELLKSTISTYSETLLEFKNASASIYRIIDDNQALVDVFVGDVSSEFFDKIPTITAISHNNSIKLIITDAPDSTTKFSVQRTTNRDRLTTTDVFLSSTSLDMSDNINVLIDKNVASETLYEYQITYYLLNGKSVTTNISNIIKFIPASKKFDILPTYISENNEIIVKISSPPTDSNLIFNSIKNSDSFPLATDADLQTLAETYSYISYVKLLKIDKKTGEILTVDMKSSIEPTIKFDINSEENVADFHYFCELFSSSFLAALENLRSTNPFISGDASWVPGAAFGGEIDDNFKSKFFSYSSMENGTLTYGEALSQEPGSTSETFKTGIIKSVKSQLKNDEVIKRHKYSFNLDIINRNIPKITASFLDENIESVLIVTTDDTGLNFRTEKAISPDRTIEFFDVKAKEDFNNILIDYLIIPVYNDYSLKSILRPGAVLCSKNNFILLKAGDKNNEN